MLFNIVCYVNIILENIIENSVIYSLGVINKSWLILTFVLASYVTYRVMSKGARLGAVHFIALLSGFLLFALSEFVDLAFIVMEQVNPFGDVFLTLIGFCFVYGFLGGLRHGKG